MTYRQIHKLDNKQKCVCERTMPLPNKVRRRQNFNFCFQCMLPVAMNALIATIGRGIITLNPSPSNHLYCKTIYMLNYIQADNLPSKQAQEMLCKIQSVNWDVIMTLETKYHEGHSWTSTKQRSDRFLWKDFNICPNILHVDADVNAGNIAIALLHLSAGALTKCACEIQCPCQQQSQKKLFCVACKA